ncbi:MAG: hypothetical protein CM15mP96_1150 [Gammaproteobacteria bacterium]|nr:MAG: hypothetical protein CM15mP96_1150 [Gammaproteobacteria bacterium]
MLDTNLDLDNLDHLKRVKQFSNEKIKIIKEDNFISDLIFQRKIRPGSVFC